MARTFPLDAPPSTRRRIVLCLGNTAVPHFLENVIVQQLSSNEISVEKTRTNRIAQAIQNRNVDLVLLIADEQSANHELRAIKAASPSMPVLVIGVVPEQKNAVQLLRSGAAGYVAR